jgi:hypothetical protein
VSSGVTFVSGCWSTTGVVGSGVVPPPVLQAAKASTTAKITAKTTDFFIFDSLSIF